MNDNGFILLSRSILDSDVFASQKLLKIWIWCLCKANYKDKSIPLKVGKGERIIKVKRGSFLFGRFKAEEQLYIDGSTIYKLMQKLKDLEMITIESNNQYSVVSICNYDIYQNADNYKVTSKEQPSNNEVTTEGQPSNTTKNINNEKELKEYIDEIYKLYPSKCIVKNSPTGKSKKDKDKIKTLLKNNSADHLKKVIIWYVDECKKNNTYMKNFSTFLNNLPDIDEPTNGEVKYRFTFKGTGHYTDLTMTEFNKRYPTMTTEDYEYKRI